MFDRNVSSRRASRWLCFVLIHLVVADMFGAQNWESGDGYRRLRLDPVGSGHDGFTLLSPEQTGIYFTNFLSRERALASQILPSGAGVAAGDVDGDGRCDLFFCGLKCGCKLYRNLGNWKFEDITAAAGVALTNLDVTGAALVDIDGDGDLDLVINSLGGGTHIFINDGHGHFTDSPTVLNPGMGGMSLALGDFDGDGRLDLYVANYRLNTVSDDPNVRYNLRTVNGQLVVASINGKPLTDPEWTNRFTFHIDTVRGKFSHEELGEPDVFYRNLGGGRFELVPFTGGAFLDEDGKPLTQAPPDWGLSVMFRDLNQDGKPDLYICNDFNTPDRIWINDGKGHFRALPRLAMRQTPLSSMAVDVADLNRDGVDEIFAVDMLSPEHQRRLVQRTNLRPEVLPIGVIDNRPQYSRNMLSLNRGDGTYAEIAQYAGLEASDWSWSPIFLDVDLDGYEDLLVGNGFIRDNMNLDALEKIQRMTGQRGNPMANAQLRTVFPPLATANLAFRNLGNLQFVQQGHEWGFDTKVISQGMCLADLDNDGDLDVIANNMNEGAGIYRNNTSKPRLAVRLKGAGENTHGVGARIRVYGGAVPMQSQEIISGGRYLSCDEAMRVFAAGSLTNRLRIEVDWPSGRGSVVENAEPNCLYEIDEAGATGKKMVAAAAQPAPFFQDVSQFIAHKHHEDPFDDFARQPTLSKRLSQLGPGVCWCDLNGDGWDDLVIGSGKGGRLAVFLNDGKGGFVSATNNWLAQTVTRDQTAIISWPQEKSPRLLVGSANYEDGQASGGSVQGYDWATGQVSDAVPGGETSVGPLAAGDMDGDGNLELFVGGRVTAGKYPQAGASRIFRNQNGRLVVDETNSRVLEGVGMVSSAVWSDLDGDGFPELILACEWGPIRVFHNDHGRLSATNFPITFVSKPSTLNPQPSTLNQLTGWWNGITTGDLDGDGRLEIIAGNWGENSKYEHHRSAPLRLYFADFNQEGIFGLLETYFEPALKKYVPERRLDIVARGMPFLRSRFNTFQAYADAGIDEILGAWLPKTQVVEANCLESVVLMNRGGSFEVRPLPFEAQIAPAFAVVVADYDGDGAEDVFLSQNFFDLEPETSRYDAGRGLWLKGDGQGGLRAVPGPESGVMVYGEQRGAAVADFDGDGRVDLVVSQNAAETRLFKNLRAKPGLRVRLKGPSGNPSGIGAQIRLKHGSNFGPVREVHGGSGYWSQDSAVQVLGGVSGADEVWVRWPGGKTFTVQVPSGAAEIAIGIDERVSRVR